MIKNTTTYLANLPIVTRMTDWTKATSFPGFQRVPFYDVLVFLYNEVFRNPMLMTQANAIAFSFFMSFFPTFIVLFSLIPFLPINKNEILGQIQFGINEIMPNQTGDDIFRTIKAFLKTKRTDFLSIGFVLAIYFSSNGLMALMKSFEKNHIVFKKRNLWEVRIRAIGMTFMLGILLFISTVLVILGNQLFGWLFKIVKLSSFTAAFLGILRWFIVVGSLYMGIAIIYRFGVAMRRRLDFFSPGASVATVCSLLSSIIFSFYVDNFSNYNKIYGSFVAGIVMLLWLQLNAIILIFGFELNAAIAVHRDLRNKTDYTDNKVKDENFEEGL